MLLPDVRQALVPLEDTAAVGHPTGNYYLLRLQKCKGQKEFTIHGLWWQNGDGCSGPKFNESALEDIEPKMEVDWMSCPEYGGDNVGFWSHEWLKHGTCSNLTEHEFFETALNLYESHKDDCSEAAEQCSICFQPDFIQCGAVGTESCICNANIASNL